MKKLCAAGIVIFVVFLFANRASAALTSPSDACRFYLSNYPTIISVEYNTENNCTLQVGDNNAGFGNLHAYYSRDGRNFCIDTSGKYFGHINIKTDCIPISQKVGGEQQNGPAKLIATPSFQITELQYDTLPTGKQIQAGDKERIELTMPDGSLIQLDAHAQFTPVSDHEVQSVFGRYRYLWQPFHDGKCIVGQNLVRQNCRKVITRDAVLAVRGTEFLVETNESGTTILVLEGLLGVADLNGKKTVEVAGGQFTYIKHGGLPDDSKPYDPTKIDRWWEKKTTEQTSLIIALMITGFIFFIFILSIIRQKILGKAKSASGKSQSGNTLQLIVLIIMFGVVVIYALSEMGYIALPKIDLSFLKNLTAKITSQK